MTELLERAVETMRGLPAETQDALARILLELAGGSSIVRLEEDDEESLKASLSEAEQGEFASDDEIRAIWAKHGL
jgi:predicted transcriptional regulator